MTRTIKKSSFRTLTAGADTLKDAALNAYGAWHSDNLPECMEHLRRLEADCAILAQQARDVMTDLPGRIANRSTSKLCRLTAPRPTTRRNET